MAPEQVIEGGGGVTTGSALSVSKVFSRGDVVET
jgi:hypothetical protein